MVSGFAFQHDWVQASGFRVQVLGVGAWTGDLGFAVLSTMNRFMFGALD